VSTRLNDKEVGEGVRIEDLEPPKYQEASADHIEHDMRDARETLAIKTATWGSLKVGDCAEEPGATLTLRSDGTASFECVTFTYSTHSGDYWWAAFQLQDKDNVTLHSEPFHKGPRMDDGHPPPRYRWGFAFKFDPAKFNAIAKVLYAYKC